MRTVQNARFDPAPARMGLSGLLSQRHCRRGVFRRSGHAIIHLPGALRSTGVTRFHRYYGSSDSCRMVVWFPAGLSASCVSPSDRSASNHPMRPVIALTRYPSARRASAPAPCEAGVVWASPFASRLATASGRIEFTVVADQPFASRYSPPRLAATQFRSATSRRAHA